MAAPSNAQRLDDGRIRVIVLQKFDHYMTGDDPCLSEDACERLVAKQVVRYAKPGERRHEPTGSEVTPGKRIRCEVHKRFGTYMTGDIITISEDAYENARRSGYVSQPIPVVSAAVAVADANSKAVDRNQVARK